MKVLKRLVSKDSSIKYLFELSDGETVESLHMYDAESKLTYHSTICVSSQVGCRIGCKFCATGAEGFVRNLSGDEIFQQVNISNADCVNSGTIPIDAVVFAGMGEPLLNYENVKCAIHKINSELGINNFELATAGVVPGIYKMIEDFNGKHINVRLNISLHASAEDQRKRIIPLACQYHIPELIKAAVDYADAFDTRVRIRYALFKGFNDTQDDVERLCALLGNKPLKLIVSRYNDNNVSGLAAPDLSEVEEFCRRFDKRIDCGIFYNFGSDIKGGCGQLRRNHADYHLPNSKFNFEKNY